MSDRELQIEIAIAITGGDPDSFRACVDDPTDRFVQVRMGQAARVLALLGDRIVPDIPDGHAVTIWPVFPRHPQPYLVTVERVSDGHVFKQYADSIGEALHNVAMGWR